ncbi:exopolysaccharide biosynthesis polyprenyl glycosylphosphotransferase [Geofilum sp. OHC36d9]|uniref:exopolysaccharide biosynthesis polyprenyl glycosylphosphotransferase n=1 Tax=Geofilum sp. OHC36d9 TaxID=3458413 RepID=UPI00403395F5
MRTNKRIKNLAPGIMAAIFDGMLFSLLLLIIPLFVIETKLQPLIAPVTSIPVEFLIPLVLIGLIALSGSYKSNCNSSGQLSVKLPIAILWSLCILIVVMLINQPPSVLNSFSYLLKIVIITGIYTTFILFNRLIVQLITGLMLKKGIICHRILFAFQQIPDSPFLKEFSRRIESNNFTLAGYCSDENVTHNYFKEASRLGKYGETAEVIKENNIDEVILFSCTNNIRQTEHILSQIDTSNVLVRIPPESKNYLLNQYLQKQTDDLPAISIRPKKQTLVYKILKRSLDIIFALAGLLFTALIYPFISALIKKESPGPVIFTQLRRNHKGCKFKLFKFRTMYTDAEKDGPALAARAKDDRITPFGHYMRRIHLDELPQFWNILKGDMSLIGIRPERDYFARILEKETPYYQFISQIKPGLTSLGMVKYGYAHSVEEMKERMFYDIIYLNNQSFIFDIQIIGNTIIYIIKRIFFNPK